MAMDALLSSLHSLSLLPPSPSQLLQLLSTPLTKEEEDEEIRDLARVLSLGSYDKDAIQGENRDADDDLAPTGFGMDRELIEDAIVEMIRTFKAEIAKLRAAYQAEEDLSSAPQPLPKATPLRFLTLRHESALRQSLKLNEIYGGYRPKLIFSGGPSYASEVELSDLSPVMTAEELRMGSRLRGKYIVVQVASSVSVYVGVTFLVTLPAPFGFSLPASLSHFTSNPRMSTEDASALLPPGTLLLIKEPYISPHHALRAGGNIGGVGLRIDTPTDVVVLQSPADMSQGWAPSWSTKFLEPLQWVKEAQAIQKSGKGGKKGNKKDEKTPSESSQRTKDISQDSPVASASRPAKPLWLQPGPRAQARISGEGIPFSVSQIESRSLARQFLEEDRPGAAWRELIAQGPDEEEAESPSWQDLNLKGEILLKMSAYEEAAVLFEKSVSLSSSVEQRDISANYLSQAQQRKKEATSGPSASGSTVASVYRAHLSSSTPRIPVADWLSSALKVSQIPNAGRGLITTRPVSAGEPLLLAKSCGSSYPADDQLDQYCPIIRCDFQNGVISTTTQILATTKLIHRMIDRPEFTKEILGLTAGPGMPDSRWVQEGSFEKAKARTEGQEAFEGLRPDRIGPEGGINSLYVDEVLRHNAFGPGVIQRGSASEHGADATKSEAAMGYGATTLPTALQRKLAQDPPSAFSRSTQPHPLPAILNHSCLPNVSSVFLGDVVVTQALRDLEQGEEIGHEYVRGGLDYQTRQSTLSKHGFVCACPLCDLDRQDGEARLATRRKLFAVQAPAIFSRSDALLAHRSDGASDTEKHQDIREVLLSFVADLDETYDEKRGEVRPEMRETLERIGRHAEREGKVAETVKYYLLSLQAVNAHLTSRWVEFLASEKPDEDLEALAVELETSSKSDPPASSSPSLALTQSPALHVDEAQRTLWRLAQLFAPPGSRWHWKGLSLHFSRTAHFVHEILIGGGFEVFEDRWGPSGLGESGGLEWQDAWDVWMQEEYDHTFGGRT